MRGEPLRFQSSLAATSEEKENPWLLLDKETGRRRGPGHRRRELAHLRPAPEARRRIRCWSARAAAPVRLRVVGALADSIFQSELLMSEKNFLRLFPEQEGYRFFLIDLPAPETRGGSAAALEDATFGLRLRRHVDRRAAGTAFTASRTRISRRSRCSAGWASRSARWGWRRCCCATCWSGGASWRCCARSATTRAHFALMVVAENALLLVCGLLTGAVCALLAIAPVFFSRGGGLPNLSHRPAAALRPRLRPPRLARRHGRRPALASNSGLKVGVRKFKQGWTG